MSKLRYILILMTAYMLAGCSDDDSSSRDYPADVCYDFVTLETNTNGSTYTLRKSGDSELITYKSIYSFKSTAGVDEGDRMIIMYSPVNGTPYTSGDIDLYGYRVLDNTEQVLVLTDASGVDVNHGNSMTVASLTRTGEYINIQANFTTKGSVAPLSLTMASDSTQVNTAYPEISIMYEAQEDGYNYYTGYASFDISSVWNLPTCQGVIINYLTHSGPSSTTFNKN